MTFLGRFDLTDEEYEVLKALLPQERQPHQAGRPWSDHRKILNGLFWRLRTGAPWRDIPERYGPWSTIQTRFRRWGKEGLWQKMLDHLQALSRKLDRIDFDFSAIDGTNVRAHKAAAGAEKKGRGPRAQPRRKPAQTGSGPVPGRSGHQGELLCEGRRLPMSVTVTPGQQSETTQVVALLDQRRIKGKVGAPRRRFAAVAGDKLYDIPRVREEISQRGSRPVIAHKRCSDGSYPPEAQGFDKPLYRRRTVVERLISRLKEWRAIATRYEKLAERL